MADGLRLNPGMALEALDRMLVNASNSLRDCLARELRQDMELVLESSKELVPKESGLLESSGEVYGPYFDSDGIFVAVQYGVTPSVFYAVDQHENLLYAHRDGRSAKYVEIPMLEWVTEGGPQGVIERCKSGFLSGGGRI